MAIDRINFSPIADGGDNVTAALVKLDSNCDDLEQSISTGLSGLGDAATKDVGTGVGTVAAGDDSRFNISGFKNKLVNASFNVNQRGYISGTATSTANQYTLDMWRVVTSGQSVTFFATGNEYQITAPAGGCEQVIEGANIEGGVYTLRWVGTATAKVNGVAIENGAQTALLPANTNVTVRFTGGTVKEPQFELGSIATAFEQRPLRVERLLCQWYFRRIKFSAVNQIVCTLQTYSTSGAAFGGLNVEEMRTAPAVSYSAVSDFLLSASTSATAPCSSLTLSANQSGFIRVLASASVSTVQGGSTTLQAANGNTYIDLDASL